MKKSKDKLKSLKKFEFDSTTLKKPYLNSVTWAQELQKSNFLTSSTSKIQIRKMVANWSKLSSQAGSSRASLRNAVIQVVTDRNGCNSSSETKIKIIPEILWWSGGSLPGLVPDEVKNTIFQANHYEPVLFLFLQFRSGRWYAAEQFDTRSKCLTYDFDEESNPDNQTMPAKKFVTKVSLNLGESVCCKGIQNILQIIKTQGGAHLPVLPKKTKQCKMLKNPR